MKRTIFLAAALLVAVPAASEPLADHPRFVVLPFRTIGVSDTTAAAFRELVSGSLEGLGATLVSPPEAEAGIVPTSDACNDAACASAAATRHHASAVYGSLSRIGDKMVVRLRAMRPGETAPYYADQIAALTEDDLDTVARRFAEGIASGRANSDRATVDAIVQEETLRPRRRATRSGAGLRAGFLWPGGGSYAGADRMTSLRLAYKVEMRDFAVETTPILGITWGEGNVEWTILDISMSRILGVGDVAGFLLGGLGVHSVHVERGGRVWYDVPGDPYSPYSYETEKSDSATTLTADIGFGLLALRTYDTELVIDVRYHHVFDTFDGVGGGGADGLLITFGTSR